MKHKGKNKAKFEEKDFLVFLPENLTEKYTNKECIALLHRFNAATNVEEQIVVLQLLRPFLTSSDHNLDITINVLSYLFVNTNARNPIKKSVLRILISAINLHSQISSNISNQILVLLNRNNVNTSQYELINDCVSSINDCFDNCPLGIVAISNIVKDVFNFLIITFNRITNELSTISSPILLQELNLYLHNSTRGLVAVSQQCDVYDLIPIYIEEFFKCCVVVLNNTNVSFDSKNNCGIILVTFVTSLGENNYGDLLRICLEENIEKWGIHSNDINGDLIVTCICSGILNVINPEDLSNKNSVFEKPVLFIICEKLLEISSSLADNLAVLLGANRALLLVSRNIRSVNDKNIDNILNRLLDHIWTHLDHYVDTIRHLVRSMLINLAKMASFRKRNGYDLCLNVLMNSVFDLPLNRSSFYIALSIIANEINVQVLLQHKSDLISELLDHTHDISVSNKVMSCYETLMKCHLNEVEEENWLNLWVLPLTTHLSVNDQLDKERFYLQNLLTVAIKLRPVILNSLLKQWTLDNEVQFSSLLKCALIARNIGVENTEISDKWRGIVDYNVLLLAMYHQNDDIKITSLSLITECHKSTEIFNKFEFQFVVTFLRYNINTQTPSTRQQILSLIKKILTRFQESYYCIMRALNKQKNQNFSLHNQQKQDYEQFIYELRTCVFDSLFPGANFSRRIISLEILTMIEPIFKLLEISEEKLWKTWEVKSLLFCLDDSYESNKCLAVKLLKQCPIKLLQFNDIAATTDFLNKALTLASSVKPSDSATAVYMLETVTFSPILPSVLNAIVDTNNDSTIEYLMVTLLLKKLQAEVKIARASLLKAAATAPMHGLLFCLRHQIEKILSNTLFDATWQISIDDIINICFEVNDIVGTVVNSSSPEGHLPMDQLVCDEDETVTSQMLLVCSWRSVKEVSLLLGEIASKAPIVNDAKCHGAGLLTEEQLLKIGDHFTVLLTETKHRGAFEQAYVGFTKLCTRLWNSQVLHQLPVMWLNDILDAILEGNNARNTKLCATRRSAGVPFMIQAIITSELQSSGSTNFHRCVSTLLEYANNPNDDQSEARTHSMNILRAIYRHTQLGEMVTQYVTDGVTVAVVGFSKNSWAERNSATLLFASLMTRIFGVQRTRNIEQLSIRNRMTGHLFFQRHPSLHGFLLEHLQKIIHDDRTPREEIGLYPILLLLARLYSSNTEESNIHNQLEDFIPQVKKCASNKILKTRELAARALVTIVPAHKRNNLIKELFTILRTKLSDANQLHGILLQIFYLLRSIKNFEDDFDFELFIQDTKWILFCNTFDIYLINSSLFMEIIILIINRIKYVTTLFTIYENLSAIITNQDDYVDKNYFVGKTIYQRTATYFLLFTQIHNYETNAKLIDLLTKNLEHNSLIIKEFVLNFLISVLKTADTEFIVNNFEIPDQEKLLARLFIDKKLSIHSDLPKLFDTLKLILISTDHSIISKVFTVLSYYPFGVTKLANEFSDNTFVYYLQKFDLKDDYISCAVLCCIRTIFQIVTIQEWDSDEVDKIFNIFLQFSSSEYDVNCRYCVSLIIKENAHLLFDDNLKLEQLFALWQTVMNLLEDGEPVVRNTVSALSSDSPVAEKCREDIIFKCINFLKSRSLDDCIALLLLWAYVDRNSFNEYNESDDIQVFEKGETSTYVETMCLSKLCAKCLPELFICDSKNNVAFIFGHIINILKENDTFWSEYEYDRNILIKVFSEIKSVLEKNDLNSIIVCLKYYFDETLNCNNEWRSLNIIRKYKVFEIVKHLIPEYGDIS